MKCRELDKTVTKLEMKVTDDRAAHESIMHSFPMSRNMKNVETNPKRKYFMVIGINTAFSSRKRRESVRTTWMPQGALPSLSQFKNLFMCYFSFLSYLIWDGFSWINHY